MAYTTLPLTFDILQEDLDEGEPLRPAFCPASRALGRATGLRAIVTIGMTRLYDGEQVVGQACHLPASDFIDFLCKVDARRPVQPARFTLQMKWREGYPRHDYPKTDNPKAKPGGPNRGGR